MSNKQNNPNVTFAAPTRRDAMYGMVAGLGSVALTSMLKGAQPFAIPANGSVVHQPAKAKAKRCIFLMMEGGPSHIDTFDPKPSWRSSI